MKEYTVPRIVFQWVSRWPSPNFPRKKSISKYISVMRRHHTNGSQYGNDEGKKTCASNCKRRLVFFLEYKTLDRCIGFSHNERVQSLFKFVV